MPKEEITQSQTTVNEVINELGILSEESGISFSSLIKKILGIDVTMQQWLASWLAKCLPDSEYHSEQLALKSKELEECVRQITSNLIADNKLGRNIWTPEKLKELNDRVNACTASFLRYCSERVSTKAKVVSIIVAGSAASGAIVAKAVESNLKKRHDNLSSFSPGWKKNFIELFGNGFGQVLASAAAQVTTGIIFGLMIGGITGESLSGSVKIGGLTCAFFAGARGLAKLKNYNGNEEHRNLARM